MYEYHVTYGAFKKIIKSESNVTKDVQEPIKKAFSLDINCSLHLQYFNAKHNDWVDLEEFDVLNEDTKLNVWQNVLDVDSSHLSTLSSDQGFNTPSINSTSLIVSECSPVNTQPPQQMSVNDFPYVYKLPQFPQWLQTMLDTRSPLCKEPKCRRALIDAIFDDLLRYGCYPTSHMFQETSRALVQAYPILKDKHFVNAQPHDSWVLRLRDKFKKYRSRHGEMCDAEEVQKMKDKFGSKTKRTRVGTDDLSDTLISVKRMKVPELDEETEDEFSINIHTKILQQESSKINPNNELINDKMVRTFKHRISFVSSHSVAETLAYFPPLRETNQLLNEASRLGISDAVLREFLESKNKSLSQLALTRCQKNERLTQLLKAQAECTCTEESEFAFSALLLPCLLQEKYPLVYAKEDEEISMLQPIIIYRDCTNVLLNQHYELFLDKQFITKTESIVSAITLWFTLYWLFNVGYSKNHVKFLSFLDIFIFKKNSISSVPRSIKTLYNYIL